MGCCGQKRADAGTSAERAGETALLRYLQNRPILVRGPATGRHYSFSGAQPLQPVHWRDIDTLVRTGMFAKDK